MNETSSSPEPKEILPVSGMKGLQGRMELVGTGQDVLNINNKKVLVDKEHLGKHEDEFQKILSSASTNERKDLWEKRGGTYEEQIELWRQSLIKGVESRSAYFAKPEQAAFFKTLGIDTSTAFDSAQADAVYNKYFSGTKTASQTDAFAQNILSQLQKPDGTYDAAKLASHTEGIRFMAVIFGNDAADIIMQKLNSTIELANNPDVFVEQTKDAVNTIPADSHEEHLVIYLSGAAQKYKEEEKKDEATPKPPKPETTTPEKPKVDSIPAHEQIVLNESWEKSREWLFQNNYSGLYSEFKNPPDEKYRKFADLPENVRLEKETEVLKLWEKLNKKYPKSEENKNKYYIDSQYTDKQSKLRFYGSHFNGKEVTRVFLASPSEAAPEVFEKVIEIARDLGIAPSMQIALNREIFQPNARPGSPAIPQENLQNNAIIAYFNREDYAKISSFLQKVIPFVKDDPSFKSISNADKKQLLRRGFESLSTPFADGVIRVVEKDDGKSWDETYDSLLKEIKCNKQSIYMEGTPPSIIANTTQFEGKNDKAFKNNPRRLIRMPSLLNDEELFTVLANKKILAEADRDILALEYRKNPLELIKKMRDKTAETALTMKKEGKTEAEIKKYIGEYLQAQIYLDHKAFPPDDVVRSGIPAYIPDGLSDMGSDKEVDEKKRGGREKIRVDKEKMFENSLDNFYTLFTTEFPPTLTQKDKEKKITEAVSRHIFNKIKYDYQNDLAAIHGGNQSINIGQIEELNLGVCRHHALDTQVMLQALGIDSRLLKSDFVDSKGNSLGAHANNLVHIEDQWYLLDTTNPEYSDDTAHTPTVFIKPLSEKIIDLNAKKYTWELPVTGPDGSKSKRKYVSRNNMFYRIRDNKTNPAPSHYVK